MVAYNLASAQRFVPAEICVLSINQETSEHRDVVGMLNFVLHIWRL